MILINTVSSEYFSLNGVQYAKIYQPLKQGENAIGIYSIHDNSQRLVSSTNFSEYSVDGSQYGTSEEAIVAILSVVYGGNSSGFLMKKELFVSPEDFGGDINAAISFGAQNNIETRLKGVNYIMTEPLELEGVVKGVKGKTTITFIEGFSNPETVVAGKSFSHVYNKNYSILYDNLTADKLDISGIHFRVEQASIMSAIMALANTNGSNIYDCKFSSSVSTESRTCIQMYSSNKNARIFNNEIRNESAYFAGGAVWVTGITGTATDDTSASENIKIYNNKIYKDSGDEAIALWGARGILRNVDVYNNDFFGFGTLHGTLISVFSTAQSGGTFSETSNITIRDNKIKTSATEFNAIRVGGDFLGETIKDVKVYGNVIEMQVLATGATYGIRKTSGFNIELKNNTILNTGTVNIKNGIGGDFDCVQGNSIQGNFEVGILNAKFADSNIININNTALSNCVKSINNTITSAVSVLINLSGTYEITGNKITPLATYTGTLFSINAGTYNTIIRGNNFIITEANQRPILYANTGYNILEGNISTGGTKSIRGIGKVTKASSNNWNGVIDDFHTGVVVGDQQLALPYGHIIYNSNPSLDANGNLVIGWQLYDNAGVSSWKDLTLSSLTEDLLKQTSRIFTAKQNFNGGATVIAPSLDLDIVNKIYVDNKFSGAVSSATFTTTDGKTVTVGNGLIINIV